MIARKRIRRQVATVRHLHRLMRLSLALCCLMSLAACNLARFQPTPTPTSPPPEKPQAQFLSPPHNQQIAAGRIIDIDILARDSQPVQRVELYIDEVLQQQSESDTDAAVYRVLMNWFARGLGWHKLSAIAYRADGAASEPAIIALEVVE